MIHEIEVGPVSACESRDMRVKGGYSLAMTLQDSARSVCATLTTTYIKALAEKSLLSHVQFIGELLDPGVLQSSGLTPEICSLIVLVRSA